MIKKPVAISATGGLCFQSLEYIHLQQCKKVDNRTQRRFVDNKQRRY
jgi:hypothetical protein